MRTQSVCPSPPWRYGLRLMSLLLVFSLASNVEAKGLRATELRTEWRTDPRGIDAEKPHLSWRVESNERGQRQTGYRLIVASSKARLARDQGDLWDTGKVSSSETLNVVYRGTPLASGQPCYWKLKTWDRSGVESDWSEPARWSMGLLRAEDWEAEWIARKDDSPVHADRNRLHLPPARHFRKTFETNRRIARATMYSSALGIYDVYVNGQRIGDAYFQPGWSDYRKRAYYRTHDVTGLIREGANVLGAVVADGWYAGYVGYGLLVGYGPNQTGRNFYGKTPAFLAQLVLEYTDGSREIVVTDTTWKVTNEGPTREADLIMGETYDARSELTGWLEAGYDDGGWPRAIRAADNGSAKAVFFDRRGTREVELGFQPPSKMQAYSAPPIRVTEELKAKRITEPNPGVYLFDFGQNFAGVIRLKVKGPAGMRIQLRYGEMLHPDGRLMTENLRRARATDYYVLRGDPHGETWSPRFTYHGFQFVEVTGLPEPPGLDAVTGLVLHNDVPIAGSFACSDPVLNQFWKNTTWTQRANFIEVPTDCPQRDERLGWMGDAQIYVRTASFNADIAAFFTKWLDDVEEAQRSFGAYPDYCPYPMAHGQPGKTFGTAWMDAGIICPWTIWKVYGDTQVIRRHWDSMTRFMEFREAISPRRGGIDIGNPWGDWLNVGEPTPIELIDAVYFARSTALMAEMAEAIGRPRESANYGRLLREIKAAFVKTYLKADGTLKVDTQTAYALVIALDLLPPESKTKAANALAEKVAKNGFHMATGFLGTKHLLPALTAGGHHDVAVRLFQSREFPSWGYEVINGANTVWERWDSFTQAHGFDGMSGNQNASMNSFSHYAFGAVMEWAFRHLAGIDTEGPAYRRIVIRPGPPAPHRTSDPLPIHWVKAKYASARGPIETAWKRDADRFELAVSIPANTTATVFLPASSADALTEGGKLPEEAQGVTFLRMEGDRAVLAVESGSYRFESKL